MKFVPFLLGGLILLCSCTATKKTASAHSTTSSGFGKLVFLDEYLVPHKFIYNQTQVGGLSGIDYDARENKYYLISDDRSNINPARFYTAEIRIRNNKIDSIVFLSVDTLRQPGGKPYPSHRVYPLTSSDPESIRYNPVSNSLFWASEGERQSKNGKEETQQAFIYEMDTRGYFLDSFQLPQNLLITSAMKGPRRNSVLEGFSFTPDGHTAFVSCEEPLLQDGSAATVNYAGALARITKFDAHTKKAVAQFTYPLDAIAHLPKPAAAFAVNGISEIMAIDEFHLLVMERSFSTGRLINTIKIYLVDLTRSSNVLNQFSVASNKSVKPAAKKLLLDTDSLNRYIDNLEGICFGPVLANGNKSILLIADNNFSPLQRTQLLLFELLP